MWITTIHPRKLLGNERGISNVIVIVLSLVILVVIAANVILWSYRINQLDWERMQEDLDIIDVVSVYNSSWSTAEGEYIISKGSRTNGTYMNTQAVDGSFETFEEGLTAALEHGCAFRSSDVRVSTTSGTPANDSEAILDIMLDEDSHIFVIYNAGSRAGSAEDQAGKGCSINIDGEDKAFSWQSPYAPDSANSVTVVWASYLSAGAHTIQGRFFANREGYSVGIDTRQLVAYWFPTASAEYVRSSISTTTVSSTPVDDVEAVLNITLDEESVAFIAYNAGNRLGSAEPQEGKGITLNVDGSDVSTVEWQSGCGFQDANSVTIAYATLLTTSSHTIKGRFFSPSGQTTTIDERQLIVFCFPADLVTYRFTESASPVFTASGDPVNDTEATLSATLTTSSNSLIIYTGGNSHGATECRGGKGVLLNVDGADKLNTSSWQSPQARDYADSATSLWSGQLSAGLHTIQGRFFSNTPGSSSPNITISHRQLLVLSFSAAAANYRLDVSNAFAVDLSTYPSDYIRTLEIQMSCRANDFEKWYLKLYNWSSSSYSNNGLNSTIGYTPSTEWSRYTVNATDKWSSYVYDNSTIRLKLVDEGADGNQTKIDVDFLAVRVLVNGAKFTFKQEGSLTCHIVSLWVNNYTHHRRYEISVFINSGERTSYVRSDISLPNKPHIIKAVTARGNVAVYSED